MLFSDNIKFDYTKTSRSKKLWVFEVARDVVSPATLAHRCASYRTNVHKTLKQNRLALSDFDEFIECYKPQDRSKRRESRQLILHCSNSSHPCESKKIDRWKSFTYDELIARDKTNFDIAPFSAIHGLHSVSPSLGVIWLKDQSLVDTENLPPPHVLASEIVAQFEAALEEFRSVEEVLNVNGDTE